MRQIKTVYTHPSVLDGIKAGADWADPTMDPTEIDWAARQDEAWIWFDVIDGRPINPYEDTGIDHGRNEFGHWGEKKMADAVMFAYATVRRPWPLRSRRRLHLVMVERSDGHGWAIPGGGVEPGEDAVAAAAREAWEETGVEVVEGSTSYYAYAPQYVPDPRASNEAWAVTTPVIYWLPGLAPVRGADDALRAAWVRADGMANLRRDLRRRFKGEVFAAHVPLLEKLLNRP